MNVRTCFTHRSHLLSARANFLLVVASLLGGCAQMSSPQQPSAIVAAVAAPDPDSYPWQNESLEATGSASAPESTAGPQRQLVARNAARVAAIKDLKGQLRQLPAGPDGTLGSIMDKYLAVRRAVEKQLQLAEIVGENPLGTRQSEVRVRLGLTPIADILRQNYITPNEEPPRPPTTGDDTGVLPIT